MSKQTERSATMWLFYMHAAILLMSVLNLGIAAILFDGKLALMLALELFILVLIGIRTGMLLRKAERDEQR